MNVLGIPGSLRRGSFNRALLGACSELVPSGMRLEIHPLTGIPPYDEDLRSERVPDAVRALGEAIAGADAVLVATPEYNDSVPGVLNNAIDWI